MDRSFLLFGFAVACSNRQNIKRTAVKKRGKDLVSNGRHRVADGSYNAVAWNGILEFYGDSLENQKGLGRNIIMSQ